MKPIIALVGRPNVGKSTLFNRLTASRAALVADVAGLTRDRHYGFGSISGRSFIVVDTGGLVPGETDAMLAKMARQTAAAIAEADVVFFLADARQGVTAHDREIAGQLRPLGRPVRLLVNKAEGMREEVAAAEFHELGLGQPFAISASHGQGIGDLMAEVLGQLPEQEDEVIADSRKETPRIAIVGRPNVGKSTLTNAILGEERVIAHDEPGTTRDSIEIAFIREGREYSLIDTAGVRRRGRVVDPIEKFSVIKTLQSIDTANVVILVLDGSQDIAEQDAHIAGLIVERGRALVVAVNKWDLADNYQRDLTKRALERKLRFLGFAKFHFMSAKTGQGIGALLRSVDQAHAAAHCQLPTPRLTRVLLDAVARQQPPRAGVSRPKMRYAHQGGKNPPLIIVHGSALKAVPESYRRYLETTFRDAFRLTGAPIRVEFRGGTNPFVGDRD